jgi:hypothetical protein
MQLTLSCSHDNNATADLSAREGIEIAVRMLGKYILPGVLAFVQSYDNKNALSWQCACMST